jgi:hypothetical protein
LLTLPLTEPNLDYMEQTLNGWMQGKAEAWNLGNIRNRDHC